MSIPNNPTENFTSLSEFQRFISTKKNGQLMIGYFDCMGYEGMALAIMIVFNTKKQEFKLDLQWICLGLDLYGDTLQESYVYEFSNIRALLHYLSSNYKVTVIDIPKEFKFDQSRFPNPISNQDLKQTFEATWRRFQLDFKKGLFLDSSQHLIFNSLEHKS